MSVKNRTIKKKRELLDTIDKLNYILEPFYRINYNKIMDLKNIIHKLENEINIIYDNKIYNNSKNIIDYSFLESKKYELNGILPTLLFSKEIFTSNKELIQFSNDVLNINIDIKSKKPRQYLVGTILYNFMEKKYDDNYDIMKKINTYINNRARSILNSQEFFKEWDKIIGNIKNE